jgi:membrane protein implicated in regulation of membrane protease activity
VVVAGQEWSARSIEEGIAIAEGAVVIVEAVSGVKLLVREK